MANTTSGTATFEKGFSISDIVEEAYERIGIQGVSGYQLKGARRSLNILFQGDCPTGDVFAFNIPEDGIVFPGGMKVSTITNIAGATLLIDK